MLRSEVYRKTSTAFMVSEAHCIKNINGKHAVTHKICII